MNFGNNIIEDNTTGSGNGIDNSLGAGSATGKQVSYGINDNLIRNNSGAGIQISTEIFTTNYDATDGYKKGLADDLGPGLGVKRVQSNGQGKQVRVNSLQMLYIDQPLSDEKSADPLQVPGQMVDICFRKFLHV